MDASTTFSRSARQAARPAQRDMARARRRLPVRAAGPRLRPSQAPASADAASLARTSSPPARGVRLRPGGAPWAPVRPSAVPALRAPDLPRGSGQPLAAPLKEEMEARLGADLSDVRLHTSTAALASAAEIGARAYTLGSHVVIHGVADRHTLAHELTHVIQQREGPVAGTDQGLGLPVSDPSDRFERAAAENARRVMSGAPPAGRQLSRTPRPDQAPPGRSSVTIQRLIKITSHLNGRAMTADEVYKTFIKGRSENKILETGVPPERIKSILAWYDSKSRIFTSAQELKAELERDAVQSVMTAEYWEDKAKAVAPEVGRNAAAASGKAAARPLKEILKTTGPALLKALRNTNTPGQLKVYRTMEREEADAILNWYDTKKEATEVKLLEWGDSDKEAPQVVQEYRSDDNKEKIGAMPVKGHLGGKEQAEAYYKNPDRQTVLEFTLKKGAHSLLFDPDYMAVLAADRGVSANMKKYYEAKGRTVKPAAGGEGKLTGYIGVKPEEKGPFSLAIGESEATQLLFQLFVEEVRDLHPRAL